MEPIENSIVFPNVHEFMYAGMERHFAPELLREWRDIASGYAEVSILWPGQNKLILSPRPIDQSLIDYHEEHFGYHIHTVVPEAFTSQTTQDFLDSSGFEKAVQGFADTHDLIHFIAWGGTGGAYRIWEHINEIKRCETEFPSKSDFWTITEFDSKLGFRRLCDKLAIIVPHGYACADLTEALSVIKKLYEKNKKCILKANWGAGGFGNIMIDPALFPESFLNVEEFIKKYIGELPYFQSGAMLVEEFVETLRQSSLTDSDISSGFANARILPNGSVLMVATGVDMHDAYGFYNGARMGKGIFPRSLQEKLKVIMQRLGEYISEQGYRGHWGINYMLRKDGEIVLIEMNPRRCGESHVHHMAEKIGGDRWMDSRFVLNRFTLDVELADSCLSYQKILELFSAVNRSNSHTLLIPVQLSWLNKKRFPGIGYMIMGEEEGTVNRIERDLWDRFRQVGIRKIK